MFVELCNGRADAKQTHQQIVKQFLVILMVTVVLVTPFVARCDGGVVNAPRPSSAMSTVAQTSKTSPTPYATPHIPSVSAGNKSQTSRGEEAVPPVEVVAAVAGVLAAFIGGSALLGGAFIGACGAVTAALIGGCFGIVTAGIAIIPGLLGVAVTIAIALGFL